MSACKNCGAEVRWERTGGRWFCKNADGSDHWDLCSKIRWQQTVATGKRFVTETKSGYADSIHGTKFDRIAAQPRKGKDYKLSGQCKNCVPPWEVCPHGCPDEIEMAVRANDLRGKPKAATRNDRQPPRRIRA